MPSINGVSFEHWEGSLTGHNGDGGEKPNIIITRKKYASKTAAYADLATWRNWPDGESTVTVILAGGESVTGVVIFAVQATELMAVVGGVLLTTRWDLLAPATWDPTP